MMDLRYVYTTSEIQRTISPQDLIISILLYNENDTKLGFNSCFRDTIYELVGMDFQFAYFYQFMETLKKMENESKVKYRKEGYKFEYPSDYLIAKLDVLLSDPSSLINFYDEIYDNFIKEEETKSKQDSPYFSNRKYYLRESVLGLFLWECCIAIKFYDIKQINELFEECIDHFKEDELNLDPLNVKFDLAIEELKVLFPLFNHQYYKERNNQILNSDKPKAIRSYKKFIIALNKQDYKSASLAKDFFNFKKYEYSEYHPFGIINQAILCIFKKHMDQAIKFFEEALAYSTENNFVHACGHIMNWLVYLSKLELGPELKDRLNSIMGSDFMDPENDRTNLLKQQDSSYFLDCQLERGTIKDNLSHNSISKLNTLSQIKVYNHLGYDKMIKTEFQNLLLVNHSDYLDAKTYNLFQQLLNNLYDHGKYNLVIELLQLVKVYDDAFNLIKFKAEFMAVYVSGKISQASHILNEFEKTQYLSLESKLYLNLFKARLLANQEAIDILTKIYNQQENIIHKVLLCFEYVDILVKLNEWDKCIDLAYHALNLCNDNNLICLLDRSWLYILEVTIKSDDVQGKYNLETLFRISEGRFESKNNLLLSGLYSYLKAIYFYKEIKQNDAFNVEQVLYWAKEALKDWDNIHTFWSNEAKEIINKCNKMIEN